MPLPHRTVSLRVLKPSLKPRVRRFAALGVAGVLLAGALSACGSSSGSDTLTLYSAQHEQTTDAMIAAFTKRTGIKVRIENNDEDVLTAQIEQEGDRSPADVFYTENSNWLQQLDNRGMLTKVAPATLAKIPGRDDAPNGDWVGVSARVSAIVYNPSKISAAELPKSILDLAEPRYQGKFELAPSETDFWPLVASVDKADGPAATVAWLKKVKANAGSNDNVPDNETLTRDVDKGTTDFAVINHYYFYRLRAEDPKGFDAKLAYFSNGDPGYVDSISGAAILKSSKHQADAQKLLAFMTSKAGQEVLAHSESFEYPLRKGVAGNTQMPPLTAYHPNGFTPADLGTGLQSKRLLQEAGLL